MELEGLSLIDLKNLAKARGIENISKLKKADLIKKILENYDSNKNEEKNANTKETQTNVKNQENSDVGYKLNSEDDEYVEGILELLPDGYGFLRGDNYLSTNKDV